MTQRTGGIDLATLEQLVADGTIDTVVVAFADLQGRLLGKRVVGRFFLDHVVGPQTEPGSDEQGSVQGPAGEGIEACDYLLTVDVDMNVVEGYRYASWDSGYGDLRAVPDLSTLCVTPWLEATALVLCDVVDVTTGEPGRRVAAPDPEAPARPGDEPRADGEVRVGARVLRSQRERTTSWPRHRATGPWPRPRRRGSASTTTCSRRPRTSRSCGPSERHGGGRPAGGVLQGGGGTGPARAQPALRRRTADGGQPHHLQERGQGDRSRLGKAITFMAKPRIDQPGSSCHIHTSIWSTSDDRPLSPSERRSARAMSDRMRAWLGGILERSVALSLCFAPYVNSYRRYQPGSWAPTAVVWSPDNRTCGLRLVGHGAGLRVESRVPGRGLQSLHRVRGADRGRPGRHRAVVSTVASRSRATRTRPARCPASRGTCPTPSRRSATRRSPPRRWAPTWHFHLLHAAEDEWRAFNDVVTEWEIRRNFERI